MKKKIHPLLERINQIGKMERGKICRMGEKQYYNHQTWWNGKNVVRYVPGAKVEPLQEAIAGYQLCMELIQQYAEEVIQNTRLEIDRTLKSGKKRPALKNHGLEQQTGSIKKKPNQKDV